MSAASGASPGGQVAGHLCQRGEMAGGQRAQSAAALQPHGAARLGGDHGAAEPCRAARAW